MRGRPYRDSRQALCGSRTLCDMKLSSLAESLSGDHCCGSEMGSRWCWLGLFRRFVCLMLFLHLSKHVLQLVHVLTHHPHVSFSMSFKVNGPLGHVRHLLCRRSCLSLAEGGRRSLELTGGRCRRSLCHCSRSSYYREAGCRFDRKAEALSDPKAGLLALPPSVELLCPERSKALPLWQTLLLRAHSPFAEAWLSLSQPS